MAAVALAPTTDAQRLDDLTAAQREAVMHPAGPLLIVAGAGTGKTTVLTRRIAWLIGSRHARPEEILALTFTEKAAREMEERVDVLVPYGYVDTTIRTFHAFGDELLRSAAVAAGLSPTFRVLSKAEQLAFLRARLFDLPLDRLRPPQDPGRYVAALATVFNRAKDEAVAPEDLLAYVAGPTGSGHGGELAEVAKAYAVYNRLLREAQVADFGDLVWLAIQLLERAASVREALRRRYRYVLVDEFQDTNYAQFRLLQLLVPPTGNVTAVADDDQSIYKWRGAALSNVLKFLEHYLAVRTCVLTENFRSPQPILDAAYRLIRFNDPDRLEVRQGIDKRLIARARPQGDAPHLRLFDTVSSETDWVARTIREAVESGRRRPSEFAILVRSNREADLFLRALNVAGIPWEFSGASGLLTREESKLLLSCLRLLSDPEDDTSWYHVASSPLYALPMADLASLSGRLARVHRTMRDGFGALPEDPALREGLSETACARAAEMVADLQRLLELSRTASAGQVLYRWLTDRGYLRQLATLEAVGDAASLETVARFFEQLRQLEGLVGGRVPEVARHLDLFEALGDEPPLERDAFADRVQVLTVHKAKGLEFSVVFLVGLVQGRFPIRRRTDPIELPDALVKDLLPAGDHHLQEERRLCYVGMTRAREELYLTAASRYGGKTVRKLSQFVCEALELPSQTGPVRAGSALERIAQSRPASPPTRVLRSPPAEALRLDAYGADDYLTCPLKYRYSHILRVPVMRHHLVAYGTALHAAIEQYFKRQLAGQPMTEEDLLAAFETRWTSEGFLTRAHEEQRRAQGRAALQRFFAGQRAAPEHPWLIEERFRFPLDDLLVVGRWDRVDREGTGAVIIDYKSSDVHEQAAADRRARESFQLLVYALAWRTLRGQLPLRLELRFLESDLVGTTRWTEDDLERGRARLRAVADGIRRAAFQPTPNDQACRWCAFQAICPHAFQPL